MTSYPSSYPCAGPASWGAAERAQYEGGGAEPTPEEVILALSPFEWWDFSDAGTLTLDTTNITSIASKGSNGTALARNSGAYITTTTGKGVCSGSQNDYRAGAGGDYDFLHSGTGSHVFVVHSKTSSTNLQYFLIDNTLGSSNDPGVRWGPNQITTAKGYQSILGKGASNLSHLTEANTLSTGLPVIAEYTVKTVAGTDDIVMRENGLLMRAATDGGELVATSHTEPMRALVSYTGDIYSVVIFNDRLSDADRKAVCKALRQYHGLDTEVDTYIFLGESVMDGDANSRASLSATYNKAVHHGLTLGYDGGDTGTTLEIRKLNPANAMPQDTTGFGPDLSAMHTIAAAVTDTLLGHLKWTVNGTSAATWTPAVGTNWNNFISYKSTYEAGLAELGLTANYVGAGISLINDGNSEANANAYATNMTTILAAIRSATGKPSLPIVILRSAVEAPGSRNDGLYQFESTVQTTQDALAGGNNTVIDPAVEATAIAWNEATPNGIHIDEAATEETGVAMGGVL